MIENNIDIKMPKMDYFVFSLKVTKNGEDIVLDDDDVIYFTVRDDVNAEDYIFQKTIGNGISYNSQLKRYRIVINSQDTKKMDMCKKYGYDITIYFGGNKPKQKVVGRFILTKKYTLNEVI